MPENREFRDFQDAPEKGNHHVVFSGEGDRSRGCEGGGGEGESGSMTTMAGNSQYMWGRIVRGNVQEKERGSEVCMSQLCSEV